MDKNKKQKIQSIIDETHKRLSKHYKDIQKLIGYFQGEIFQDEQVNSIFELVQKQYQLVVKFVKEKTIPKINQISNSFYSTTQLDEIAKNIIKPYKILYQKSIEIFKNPKKFTLNEIIEKQEEEYKAEQEKAVKKKTELILTTGFATVKKIYKKNVYDNNGALFTINTIYVNNLQYELALDHLDSQSEINLLFEVSPLYPVDIRFRIEQEKNKYCPNGTIQILSVSQLTQ